VQPFASLLYSHLNEGSFQESGANSLNMKVDTRATNSVVSELGLRAARPIHTSKGTLVPEVKASWQYDFGVDRRTMPISFAGSPVGLSVDGRNLAKSSGVGGAGLTFTSKGGITTSVQYDGEFRSGYDAHGVMGQIRLSF
jgi:outer membrane autotransporter protein